MTTSWVDVWARSSKVRKAAEVEAEAKVEAGAEAEEVVEAEEAVAGTAVTAAATATEEESGEEPEEEPEEEETTEFSTGSSPLVRSSAMPSPDTAAVKVRPPTETLSSRRPYVSSSHESQSGDAAAGTCTSREGRVVAAVETGGVGGRGAAGATVDALSAGAGKKSKEKEDMV